MKTGFLKIGIICTASITAMISSAGIASAYTISSEQEYYDQLGNKEGLNYELWNRFNEGINTERFGLGKEDLEVLDLNELTWLAGVDPVEVFFINEGAGYRNKFFYDTEARDPLAPNDISDLTSIWDDVASPYSILSEANGPLSLGEGVNLGQFEGETRLNFFLQNPQGDVFGTDAATDITFNPDDLQHVTAYRSGEYMVIGFEDITGGGDRDYNDVVIAVKGLVDTADKADVPEPASTVAIAGMALFGLVRRRRRH
ncbi:MAG: DUF4114 domain-containing protein [Cyanobacteria bacterium J06635_1]